MPRRPRSRRAPSVATIRAQHESQCTICSHLNRAAIEDEFMHWHDIDYISCEYKVSRSAIYRHAHAMRLFARRNLELRFALGHLIERVQDVEPTAASIVRAIHLFARINDDGELTPPPAHVIVSSGKNFNVPSVVPSDAQGQGLGKAGAEIHRQTVAGSHRRPIAISLDSSALATMIDAAPHPLANAPDAEAQPLAGALKGGTLNRPCDHATY